MQCLGSAEGAHTKFIMVGALGLGLAPWGPSQGMETLRLDLCGH